MRPEAERWQQSRVPSPPPVLLGLTSSFDTVLTNQIYANSRKFCSNSWAVGLMPRKSQGEKRIDGSIDGLANALEEHKKLRRRVLKTGSFLTWPNPAVKGVMSLPNVANNHELLTILINLWAPQWDDPVMIPVDDLKKEARGQTMFLIFLTQYFNSTMSYIILHPTCQADCQVTTCRVALELPESISLVHTDARSMKGLFTLLCRRHDGSKRAVPRNEVLKDSWGLKHTTVMVHDI